MAAIKTQILIDAVDNVTATLSKIQGEMNKLGGSVNTLSNSVNNHAVGSMDRFGKSVKEGNMAAFILSNTLGGVVFKVGAMAGGLLTVQAIVTDIALGFKWVMNEVDKYRVAIATTASLAMTMRHPKNGESETQFWAEANKYSADLAVQLDLISAKVLMTGAQVNLMAVEFEKWGVWLDTANQKQVDAFEQISNTLYVLTGGYDVERQIITEIGHLMQGQVTAQDRLGKFLLSQDKDLKSHLKTWVKQGDVMEHVSYLARGFAFSVKDLEGTLLAMKTTTETVFSIMARQGLRPIYDAITGALKDLNFYLLEHRQEVIDKLRVSAQWAADVFKNLLEILKKIGPVLDTIAKNAGVIQGILTALALNSLLGLLGTLSTKLLGVIGAAGGVGEALKNLFLINKATAFIEGVASFAANMVGKFGLLGTRLGIAFWEGASGAAIGIGSVGGAAAIVAAVVGAIGSGLAWAGIGYLVIKYVVDPIVESLTGHKLSDALTYFFTSWAQSLHNLIFGATEESTKQYQEMLDLEAGRKNRFDTLAGMGGKVLYQDNKAYTENNPFATKELMFKSTSGWGSAKVGAISPPGEGNKKADEDAAKKLLSLRDSLQKEWDKTRAKEHIGYLKDIEDARDWAKEKKDALRKVGASQADYALNNDILALKISNTNDKYLRKVNEELAKSNTKEITNERLKAIDDENHRYAEATKEIEGFSTALRIARQIHNNYLNSINKKSDVQDVKDWITAYKAAIDIKRNLDEGDLEFQIRQLAVEDEWANMIPDLKAAIDSLSASEKVKAGITEEADDLLDKHNDRIRAAIQLTEDLTLAQKMARIENTKAGYEGAFSRLQITPHQKALLDVEATRAEMIVAAEEFSNIAEGDIAKAEELNNKLGQLNETLVAGQYELRRYGLDAGQAFKEGLQSFINELPTIYDSMVAIAKGGAEAMTSSMDSLFFDAMEGKLRSFKDYLNSFLSDINRIISKAFASTMMKSLFGLVSGQLGGGEKGGAGFFANFAAALSGGSGLKSTQNMAVTAGVVNINGSIAGVASSATAGTPEAAAKSQLSSTVSSLYSTVGSVFSYIGNGFKSLGGGILSTLSTVWSTLSSVINRVSAGGSGGGGGTNWGSILGTVISVIGAVGGASSIGNAGITEGVGGGFAINMPTGYAHTGGFITDYVPRFHNGGLLPDERVIVAQTRERVLSRKQNDLLEKRLAEVSLGDSPRRESPPIIVNMHVAAMDAASFNGYIMKNKEAIAGAMMAAVGDNHPVRKSR